MRGGNKASTRNYNAGTSSIQPGSAHRSGLLLIHNEAALYESGADSKDGSELASLLAATADVFKGMGCFEEANQLLFEAVVIRRQLIEQSVLNLALCLNDYGVLLLVTSAYSTAIEFLQEARGLTKDLLLHTAMRLWRADI